MEGGKRKRMKRKVDDERFKQMWNDGVLGTEIAKTFGICYSYVSWKAKSLGLSSRRMLYPIGAIKKAKEKSRENDIRVFEFIKENGGFCNHHALLFVVSDNIISRMVIENKIHSIQLDFGRSSGKYKRNIGDELFNDGFYLKTFYCLERTGIVRLLQSAIKYPDSKGLRNILTHFLNNLGLTKAEMIAVMWKAGKRDWRRGNSTYVKQSIQIDGMVYPARKKLITIVSK